jgi:hypothetical protein
VQVVVATITSDADGYALEAAERLRAAGLAGGGRRPQREDQLQGREHSLTKTPVIAVVGRKEAETGQVALRPLWLDRQADPTLRPPRPSSPATLCRPTCVGNAGGQASASESRGSWMERFPETRSERARQRAARRRRR